MQNTSTWSRKEVKPRLESHLLSSVFPLLFFGDFLLAKIQANFDEVPDKIPQIDPGVYTVQITKSTVDRNKKDDGDNLVLELKIDDSASPNHNRTLKVYCSLKPPYGLIGLKKIAKSCGIVVGKEGVDTDDFLNKHAKVKVGPRVYNDAETGEAKEASEVKEWLVVQ